MTIRRLALLAVLLLGGTAPATWAQAQNPCAGVTPVSLQAPPNLLLPKDFSGSQIGADCVAWQEFLYLNWAADPAHPGKPDPNATVADYGKPGNTAQTVWESYLEASQVFSPTLRLATAWAARRPAIKDLSRLSKLGDIELSSIAQADSHGWLTDQSGNLVFYEVRLNQDEYEFITHNQLTTFAGQAACAKQPGTPPLPDPSAKGGFNLPSGGGTTGKSKDYDCAGNVAVYGENAGAIELKAAWRVMPSDGSLNGRYKIAQAVLHKPDGTTQKATVGLIGLHIIHKMPSGAQFVWATFEQVDNDPDAGSTPSSHTFSLFNPACNPGQDPVYNCAQNETLVTQPNPLPPCPNRSYQPGKCYPYWAPMQITRVTPVRDEPNQVSAWAWGQMSARSVFKYYRLIEVQWPSNPTRIPPQAPTPLSAGGITPAPDSYIVANTTMETFVQTTKACMTCHMNAPIAQPKAQTFTGPANHLTRHVRLQASDGPPPYAANYSFVFASETRH